MTREMVLREERDAFITFGKLIRESLPKDYGYFMCLSSVEYRVEQHMK